jgi:hypothetical protein
MTKHVFSNSMVAHVWAQQTQIMGRNAKRTMWFEGSTLYSYRTPIASIVKDKDGATVVLLSERRYSSTTGPQISAATNASIQYPQYTVPDLGIGGGQASTHAEYDKFNVTTAIYNYAERVAKMKRQRHPVDYWDESYLKFNLDHMREYAKRFNVEVDWPDTAQDWIDIVYVHDIREKIYNSPEAVAKRAKEKVRKDNRDRKNYRELKGKFGINYHIPSWGSGEYYKTLFTEEDRAAREILVGNYWKDTAKIWVLGEEYVYLPTQYITKTMDKQRTANVRAREADKLQRYRDGDIHVHISDRNIVTNEDRIARDVALRANPEVQAVLKGYIEGAPFSRPFGISDVILTDDEKSQYEQAVLTRDARAIEEWREGGVNFRCPRTQYALLRWRGGTIIDTSWGANFPVEHARSVYPLLKAYHDAGREYVRNGHSIRLGHFTIDSFRDGIITAGCHRVQWEEVHACAIKLGIETA